MIVGAVLVALLLLCLIQPSLVEDVRVTVQQGDVAGCPELPKLGHHHRTGVAQGRIPLEDGVREGVRAGNARLQSQRAADGRGEPEGYWSRHIADEHRLVEDEIRIADHPGPAFSATWTPWKLCCPPGESPCDHNPR